MNKAYRIVFNKNTQKHQVTSEISKSRGKTKSKTMMLFFALAATGLSQLHAATVTAPATLTTDGITPSTIHTSSLSYIIRHDPSGNAVASTPLYDIENTAITMHSGSTAPLAIVLHENLDFKGTITNNSTSNQSLDFFSDRLGAQYARTLTLNNALNSGVYNVILHQDFTLKAGAANVFSAQSVHDIGANSAIDLGGFDQTIAGLTSPVTPSLNATNRLNLGSNNLTINQTAGHSYRGAVNGSGNIYITNATTQYAVNSQEFLGNNSAFNGKAYINDNGIIFGAGVLGATEINISGFGILLFRSGTNAESTYDGNIIAATQTGGERLQLSSGTTLNFGGTSNHSGDTLLNTNSTLKINKEGALLSENSFHIMNSGSTIDLNNFNTNIGSFGGANSAGSKIILGSGTLTFGNKTQYEMFEGVISGSGGITKIATTEHTLSGANTYSGLTTINAGTLSAGAASTFSGSSIFHVASGATLDLKNFNQSMSSLSGAGTVRLGSATLTLNSASASTDTEFSGVIRDTGHLVKSGLGRLVLSGNNTYQGTTTINNGTLVFSGSNNAAGNIILNSGTLQLGNGGTTGKIGNGANLINDTVNNGTLAFNRSDDIAFSSLISGTGGLTQLGSGTLTIANNNTYTGVTRVANGVLQLGNNSTTGSVAGNILIDAGTRLEFNRSDDLTYNKTISGAGDLHKNNNNVLTLTGDSVFSGDTHINAGALQIGAGGSSGSLLGNIINNAQLIFNRSDDLDYSKIISGTGDLEKKGSGTLTISSDQTYQGDTTITSGSLQLGNGGTSGSVLGAIINNGSLIVNRSDDINLSNDLSGSGSLIKLGANTLTIDNSPSAAGGTQLRSGKLIVGSSAGSSARLNSDIEAASGSVLGGHGTIGGNLNLTSGARLAPGNSIGTLRIDGDVRFNPNSVLEMEVEPTGSYDRLLVSGALELGGATLHVEASNGNWVPDTRYTIIEAGNLTGSFADITTNLAFLAPTLESTNRDATLILVRNSVDYGDIGQNDNQTEVGNSLDSNPSSPPYNELLGLTEDQAREVFNQLSGEIHVSARAALFEESRHLRESVHNRLYAIQSGINNNSLMQSENPNGLGLWIKAYGGQSQYASNRNAAKLDNDSKGTLIGLDLALNPNWRAGLVAGYSQSDLDVHKRESSAKINSTSLGAYIGGQWDRIHLRAGAAYSWNDVDSRRHVRYGQQAEKLKANYNANSTQVFTELGYAMTLGQAQVEPFIGATYVQVDEDNLREHGGNAALRSHSSKNSLTYSSLGARLATPLGTIESMPVNLQSSLTWQHVLDNPGMQGTLSLADHTAFKIKGVEVDKNAAVAQLGLNLKVNDNTHINLNYSGLFGKENRDNAIRLGVDIAF